MSDTEGEEIETTIEKATCGCIRIETTWVDHHHNEDNEFMSGGSTQYWRYYDLYLCSTHRGQKEELEKLKQSLVVGLLQN